MSCDNVPHNGKVCRDAVAGLAAAQDPSFAAWVRDNVAFPNAMVDRIAPATSDRERRITRDEFGIEDAWPVFCEDFIQWVVEDQFPAGRPAFEEVGAEFVSDVTPCEMMKIRILNGGHAIIAYPVRPAWTSTSSTRAWSIRWSAPSCRRSSARRSSRSCRRCPNTDLDGYFRKVEERCLQPQDRRHHPPALPRRLEPPAQVHHPLDRRPPRPRPARRRPRARERALVPLLRRHHRQRHDDRAERPELGAPDRPGRRRQARPRGLARDGRHLRRHRRAPAFRDAFARWLARALVRRHRRDAAPLPRRRPRVTATGLVIFDCDGVLVDSEPIASRLLLETLAGAGLAPRPRPRSTRASSAARSPRPARSSPATSGSRSPTRPRRDAPAALCRVPRRAPADPRHRRDPRRAALRLLRRLLVAAGADRALADA